MLHLAHTFWAANENAVDIVGGIKLDRIAAAAAGCLANSLENGCICGGDVVGLEAVIKVGNDGYPFGGISLRLRS